MELSTTRPALYVQYLSTTALVRCVADIELALIHSPSTIPPGRRELLLGIKEDCLWELNSRQMAFPELAGD
jgi:hypothetical protein